MPFLQEPERPPAWLSALGPWLSGVLLPTLAWVLGVVLVLCAVVGAIRMVIAP